MRENTFPQKTEVSYYLNSFTEFSHEKTKNMSSLVVNILDEYMKKTTYCLKLSFTSRYFNIHATNTTLGIIFPLQTANARS